MSKNSTRFLVHAPLSVSMGTVSNLLRNSLDLHKDLLVNGPESARQEAVEHGQRGFRLVHGCHVASVVYLQELQLASASEQSDLAQAFNRPWLVLGVIESLLAVPVQIQGPRLVAHEVADEVQIARVDQHRDVRREDIGDLRVEVLHPVRAEVRVHVVVARDPLGGFRGHVKSFDGRVRLQELLLVAEVVAELAFALLGEVIHVATCDLVGRHQLGVAEALRKGADGRAALALLDQLDALGHGRLHRREDLVADRLDALRVVHSHAWVVLVLDLRLRETVADAQAQQVDQVLGIVSHAVHDAARDRGRVVAPIRLGEEVQAVLCVLRMALEHLVQEGVHVVRHLGFVVVVVVLVAVAEAHAGRLVDPHDVGVLVPGVQVAQGGLPIIIDLARAVLGQQRQLRRAARPAREPNCSGGALGVVSRLEHPKEVVFVGRAVDFEVSGDGFYAVFAHLRHFFVLEIAVADGAVAEVHERFAREFRSGHRGNEEKGQNAQHLCHGRGPRRHLRPRS
mmetsp:Transcript_16748/g.63680  ORF Transcript_16748/g.63680 Transcript_16748/m.63680 type:complete len:510 (+) Transcript_16748:626-2155(+)